MSQYAAVPVSAAEFLEWDLGRPDGPHELVDGVPVPKHQAAFGMVGARGGHDRIVMNLAREIGVQLRGKPCQPFSEALAVRIPAGNIRRPDLGVQCGPFDQRATAANDPKLVIEVLSESTRAFDQARKLEEYKTVETLDYVLLVDPDVAEVILWSRDAARTWQHRIIEGLDAVVEMPALGVVVALADLYEGLTLKTVPRLVREGG
jgi:Uma2 family endonuclease